MRPKKDNEVKEAQLDPGYLSPRKMPWPDSISLIRESWISQLEFLVNTEAREYQDDGLDGEKGWLSFFFSSPFFFLTKKKIDFSIQIIFFLMFEKTYLSFIFCFDEIFRRKEYSIITIWQELPLNLFLIFIYELYSWENS